MKKLQITKYISLIVTSLFSLVMSLVYFINSREVYTDEYGTDISFSEDYSVAIMVSLLLLGFAIYALVSYLKDKKLGTGANAIVGAAVTSVVSFYSLGVFFKKLFKCMTKNETFDFKGYQAYLWVGILLLLVLVYFIMRIVIEYKEKTND